MKPKKAYIRWTGRLDDHAQLNLHIGLPYYPHIVLNKDPDKIRWSVQFVVTEVNKSLESMIDLLLLVDNAESRCFWESISPGDEFVLLEGKVQVAYGVVLL